MLAQVTGPEYTVQMTEQATGSGEISFLTLFIKGGYILIPIVLLSIVAVYLIIKKYSKLEKALGSTRAMSHTSMSF